MKDISVDGHVVKVVSDDELIINLGQSDGVQKGDLFHVLDEQAMDLTDPHTGEDLGAIGRVLATVQVVKVADHVSIAAVYPKRTNISEIGALLTGASRPKRTLSEGWPEGIARGDPIVRVQKEVHEEATETVD